MKRQFYFVRHGETLFNSLGYFQGSCDSPLSEEGIDQIENTASVLRNISFQKIFVSSSERALDTARIICQYHDIKPIALKELREIALGEAEAMPYKEYPEVFDEMMEKGDWSSIAGESAEEISSRVQDALRIMLEESKEGDRILVIGHGLYYLLLLKELFGIHPKEYREKRKKEGKHFIGNGGVAIFDYEDGQFTFTQEALMPEEIRQNEKKKINFYFVRHGETKFNTQFRLQGACDSPLTENGIAQARQAKEALKDIPFSKAYVSTSTRARDTAEIILGEKGIEAIPTKKLKEVNFGSLEGIMFLDMREKIRERHMHESWSDIGGENYDSIQKRIKQIFREMADAAKDGENILVVSHGKIYMNLLEALFQIERSTYFAYCEEKGERPIPNAGITKIIYEDGKFKMDEYMKRPEEF